MNQNNQNNQSVLMERTIKLTSNGNKHELKIRMSFENVSKSQLLTWAFADRIIALQRVLRECSTETLETFALDGFDVHALAAGTKPKTFSETKNEIKSHLASLSPEERKAMIEELTNR